GHQRGVRRGRGLGHARKAAADHPGGAMVSVAASAGGPGEIRCGRGGLDRRPGESRTDPGRVRGAGAGRVSAETLSPVSVASVKTFTYNELLWAVRRQTGSEAWSGVDRGSSACASRPP